MDDPSPSQGDTVNFTITAQKEKIPGSLPIDLQVDIGLTDGLTVSGTPTYVSTDYNGTAVTKPDSVSYSNGVFTVGRLQFDSKAWINSVTLPITVSTNAVLNEQCLTATLTGNPPPGVGPHDDDISDNVAKLCLVGGYQSGVGPNEKVVLNDGTADLWALYPCIGVTAVPCDNTDSVVLAVNGFERCR